MFFNSPATRTSRIEGGKYVSTFPHFLLLSFCKLIVSPVEISDDLLLAHACERWAWRPRTTHPCLLSLKPPQPLLWQEINIMAVILKILKISEDTSSKLLFSANSHLKEVKVLATQSCPPFATSWTAAHQAVCPI